MGRGSWRVAAGPRSEGLSYRRGPLSNVSGRCTWMGGTMILKVFKRRMGLTLTIALVALVGAGSWWMIRKGEAMKLFSPAFGNGGPIPARYAYCGPGAQNLSPPLEWGGVPAGAESFALLVQDPDAPGGSFVHWVVYDLPGSLSALPEGVSGSPELTEGANDYGTVGYGGPCPPPGPAHRYFFTLYALRVPSLGLPSGATAAELARVMDGTVLEKAEWMGTYQR